MPDCAWGTAYPGASTGLGSSRQGCGSRRRRAVVDQQAGRHRPRAVRRDRDGRREVRLDRRARRALRRDGERDVGVVADAERDVDHRRPGRPGEVRRDHRHRRGDLGGEAGVAHGDVERGRGPAERQEPVVAGQVAGHPQDDAVRRRCRRGDRPVVAAERRAELHEGERAAGHGVGPLLDAGRGEPRPCDADDVDLRVGRVDAGGVGDGEVTVGADARAAEVGADDGGVGQDEDGRSRRGSGPRGPPSAAERDRDRDGDQRRDRAASGPHPGRRSRADPRLEAARGEPVVGPGVREVDERRGRAGAVDHTAGVVELEPTLVGAVGHAALTRRR